MRYLIFGGTGFIGSRLTTFLKEAGHDVLAVSRSGVDGSTAMDITRESEFSNIKFQPDVVINAASKIPEKGKDSSDSKFVQELFMTNVIGAINICNWSVKNNVRRVINCSTLSVVKRPWPIPLSEEDVQLPEGPHTSYAMSKLSQEQLMDECIRGSNTDLIHLRLSAVYGEGMPPEGILFTLIEKLERDEDITLTDSQKNTLDFIHVDDVCRAIGTIAENEVHETIINVASGRPVSIIELAEILKHLSGSQSGIYNKNTNRPASEAVIETKKLKERLGRIYEDFIPLEKGLYGLLQDKGKTVTAPEKRSL